jgi:hypothetical protein
VKPSPEHVNRRFRHLPTGVIVAYVGRHIDSDKPVIYRARGGWTVIDADVFDRDFELLPGMPDLTTESPMAGKPLAGPADLRSLLSRLLAAGFDDVEIALRATAADPLPSYRLIGYWREERISYTAIASDEGDLGRIEAAVVEKLEALKAERAAKGES